MNSFCERKSILLICLALVVWSAFVQWHELSTLNSGKNQFSLTHYTADDASYLAPAHNFIDKGEWKDNSLGMSSYYQRPPGFGFLYVIGLSIFGNQAVLFLSFIQFILYFIQLYLIYKIIIHLTKSKKWALGALIIFGLLPSSFGFLTYQLTESITPGLMIVSFYFLLRIYKAPNEFKWHLGYGLIGGFLILVRPQLIPFVLIYGLLPFISTDFLRKYFSICLLFLLGPWMMWQARNYSVSNEISGLHPVYHVTNNTQYRPVHESFSNLFRVWEHNSANFHGVMVPIWENAAYRNKIDLDESELKRRIQGIDDEDKIKVIALLKEYAVVSLCQYDFLMDNQEMPSKMSTEETKLIMDVEDLNKEFKSKYSRQYYLNTPLASFKELILHSHLNLAIFQFKYRGQWWMECLRWTCFLVFVFVFFSAIILPWFQKEPLLKIYAILILIYIFYLVYVQRMNEERYLTPLYALVFVLSAVNLKFLLSAKEKGI